MFYYNEEILDELSLEVEAGAKPLDLTSTDDDRGDRIVPNAVIALPLY